MTLYEKWVKTAYTKDGQQVKKTWDDYIPREQKIYDNMLTEQTTEISGTVAQLAERFDMPPMYVAAFLDGINDALEQPVDMETLEEETEVFLHIDFERLYKKMVEYKAKHLYTLPEWDGVFTQARQKELYTEQKTSTTIVKEKSPSRNDPCPCGSGKKYKKCCGGA